MSPQVLQQSSYGLTLTGQEREFILGLLRQAFGESRIEAHRTHTPDFRDLVLGQESVLRNLITRIERLAPEESTASSAIAGGIEEEMPLIEDLLIDDEGRFQMVMADLEDFIRFLRDNEVRVEIEKADAFRSGGVAYGYGRLIHPYDTESASNLYRTWKLARAAED